jgi:hypothetical protein
MYLYKLKMIDIFEEYLDKEFDDNIIKETVKKLILKIYIFLLLFYFFSCFKKVS